MNIARWQFEHAGRFGDEIALIRGDWMCTNAQLCDRCSRLASAFIALGKRPGERAVVALPNVPDLHAAVFAIYQAGLVLVVQVDTSAREIARVVQHCGATLLITRAELAAELADELPGVTLVSCGPSGLVKGALDLTELAAEHVPLPQLIDRSPHDPVQLCYTSGTTDTPKAAIYTHGGFDAYLRDRAAFMAGIEAPVPILIALPAPAFGARLIAARVVSNQRYVLLESFDPDSVLAAIDAHRVQAMPLLPTMAEQLVVTPRKRAYDLDSLKAINISGAHVPATLVTRLRERLAGGRHAGVRHGDLTIVVHYGMTETGGGIASSETGGSAGDGDVGRVVPGVEVRIVSPDGSSLPCDEVGEIVARTPYAAIGYWANLDASERTFREGFIYTGDLGRLGRNGVLSVVGRCKDIINQGGVKVLPSDVSRVIECLPGVAECAVVGIEDELLGEEVVACIVGSVEKTTSEKEVLTHCRAVLERRKCPAEVVFIEELPRTHAGKRDTRALRNRVLEKRESVRARHLAIAVTVPVDDRERYVRAGLRSALTEVLEAGWEASLRAQEDVTFGELGLDSLGSVRLAHQLNASLGTRIAATAVYAYPTVGELCVHLQRLLWGEEVTPKLEQPELLREHAESIAIVGIGCRVPGANGPVAFWKALERGADAIRAAPEARHPGKPTGWTAAFLEDAAHFDAAFFRLESRAAGMDPRHRWLLELAWEACEDAGQIPTAMQAERTGVFIGIYGERYRSPDALGTAPGMAVAYLCQFLDLRGPVASFDTTCSSSLVAIHHAVNSLQQGECDVALAGGANLLSGPVEAWLPGLISPDGRCRAFAAEANGFGQGEGCVLFVLKRLSRARVDRDRIYATLLATAINHDGRSSSLTAPNPRSQEAVIRDALRKAAVLPESVQYIEAHGTGTLLGDQIECEVLGSVFGERQGPFMAIGSVKTNIGHLEAAAGAAGVAKVALAIAHARLPASLQCQRPNPRIPWERLPLRVQTELTPWPAPEGRRIAGVSSFGMSGTNAHAIVAEPPIRVEGPGDSRAAGGIWILPLSAKTERSVRRSAARWAQALRDELGAASCRDVAYSASCRRAHFEQRAAVVGNTHCQLIERLLVVSRGESMVRLARTPARLVLLFCGQGVQRSGMGRELFEHEPVFRDSLRHCASLIDRHVSWRLLDELFLEEGSSRLAATDVAQPALFALQIALFDLWKSWGVQPDAVVGHSLGELAAACAAGVITLEQGSRLVCARGQALESMSGVGAMMHVSMSLSEGEALCGRYAGKIEIAAFNGPRALTLSGESEAVAAALLELERRGIVARRLSVNRAFHSSRMSVAAQAFTAALGNLTVKEARIPLVSTVTPHTTPMMDERYWGGQVLAPVRFTQAANRLFEEGYTTFLEIGPQPVLREALLATWRERSETSEPVITASLRRDLSERESLARALGDLYCAGVTIDWPSLHARDSTFVSLPGYAWDHVPYWHDAQIRPSDLHDPATAQPNSSPVPSLQCDGATCERYLSDLLTSASGVPADRIHAEHHLSELGIDSVGGMHIRAGLRRGLGVAVPAAAWGQDPTVTEMLADLAARTRVPSTPHPDQTARLVWIKRASVEPTLVWIHPIGAGVDCYRRLAEALPFSAAAIDVTSVPDTGQDTLQAMAQRYRALLQHHQLSGPLLIGGWSFGGVVAYEMAVQFGQAGQHVPLVALVDSYLSLDASQAEFSPQWSWRDAVDEAHAKVPEPDRSRLQSIFDSNRAMLRSYRPDPFDGPVLSIRASQRAGDPDVRWRQLAPALECEAVTADHYSILRSPAVEAVARAVGLRIPRMFMSAQQA